MDKHSSLVRVEENKFNIVSPGSLSSMTVVLVMYFRPIDKTFFFVTHTPDK